ncbi:MAG: YfiR family protein [Enterobacterales bacterium]|nr:YfiR family protein [Enterobacterales bacterium]
MISPSVRTKFRRYSRGIQSTAAVALIFALSAQCFPVFAAETPVDSPQLIAVKEQEVAKVVIGMIRYTRWANSPDPIKLCIVPPARYARLLVEENIVLPSRHVSTQIVDFSPTKLLEQCDVVYFGNIKPGDQELLIQSMQGKSILTIAEDNPECIKGSAFCLRIDNSGIAFDLNLDILARSNVQVNPNVLLLAKKKGN